MGSPYSSTTVSGYNSNPPPDDGSTGANNKITWAGIKTKLGDPLNTFSSAVNTSLVNAFGKTLDGATVVATGVSYPMTSADQGRVIKATAPGITITTPDAGTVLSPFCFAVSNQSTGTITIAGNATNAQTVDAQTTQVIAAGSGCLVWTDGSNWVTSGLKTAQIQSTNPPYGFDVPINLQINASVGSNILTIAVKSKNTGSDATASDPVLVPFRDSTIANGDPVWVTISSALSITTNAVGATLGSQNTVPFRFWICLFNNAGTAVLALINCSTTAAGPPAVANIFPLNETILQSTTGISAAATSGGVFYTPNGTSLSSKAFRVIGYLEYASGLTTAGTYASVPTILQLFGPGVRLPGTAVQTSVWGSTATATTATLNTPVNVVWNATPTITPASTCNFVRARLNGMLGILGGAGNSGYIRLFRATNATPIGSIAGEGNGTANNVTAPCSCEVLDNPASAASVTYGAFVNSTVTAAGTSWLPGFTSLPVGPGYLTLEEIVG